MESALVSGLISAIRAKIVAELKQRQRSARKEDFDDKDMKFLNKELRSMRAALSMVREQQLDRLDTQTKMWAREVRELSYNTEDLLDSCLALEEVRHQRSHGKGFIEKMANNPIFKQRKARQQIASDIRGLRESIEEISRRNLRYTVDKGDALRASGISIDPRIVTLYTDPDLLIDIAEARDELIRRLEIGDAVSNRPLRVVSLVGLPGVGKTTLANEVYKFLITQFDCRVFVSVSTNPNMKKILHDMLWQLDRKYSVDVIRSWDQTKLTDEIQEILRNKRYFILLDDIWDTKSWTTLKDVIVNNNPESIIMTTTRKVNVAEEIGGVYRVKPLSHESTKKLFYKRLFSGDECASSRADGIIDKFVKKSGGVPLVIIAISSLLADEQIERWHHLYNSIDSSEQSVISTKANENFIWILSLSYYHLPSHLKTCLLYIRLFPEDYVIRRDRLVWMWIVEGFIHGKQPCHLFELGQSYIDELLYSNMIEEVDSNDGDDDGMVKYCRVPKIVLPLISYLSTEENFVTVVDNDRLRQPCVQKPRRISLQNVGSGELSDVATDMYFSQVRSASVFGPVGNSLMPLLLSCKLLRVLDLEGSDLQSYNLKNLGMLLHLRYLGLRGTLTDLLPEEIGNLLFLQVLDLKGTRIKELPSTVAQLRHLLCMCVEYTAKQPKGMGQLTSLEELSNISIAESPALANEVASLVELRVLGVVLQQDAVDESSQQRGFLESLSNLEKLKTLRLFGRGDSDTDLDFLGQGWVPPPALRSFITVGGSFSVLPTWIPSVNLSELQIGIRELRPEDLQALGMLQELRALQLTVERMMEKLAVDAEAFPRLRVLRLRSQTCLVFQRGAMPAIRTLEFALDVDKADSQFDWGLHNLTLLEQITSTIRGANASAEQVLEAEAAVKNAASNHPNRPTIQIATVPSGQQIEQRQLEDGAKENSNSAGPSEIVECSA